MRRVPGTGHPDFTRKAVPKPVKKYVKNTIDANKQNCEKIICEPNDRETGQDWTNHAFHGIPQVEIGVGGTTTDLMRLFPQIQQGDSREQRLGSKLRLKNINCRFLFMIPATVSQNTAHACVQCRLLVLSSRKYKSFSEVINNWDSDQTLSYDWLRSGEQATRYKGDNHTLNLPVNSAMFVTHLDKKFTLNRGRSEDTQNHVPTPTKIINFNLKCKNKIVRYADDADTEPQNFAPFAVFMYSYASGTVIVSTSSDIVTGYCDVKANWKNM